MKIRDVEFHIVRIGCGDGGSPARSVLACLTSDSGEEGWGEAALPWRLDELAARRDALLPSLEGRSIFEVEELVTLDAVDTDMSKETAEKAVDLVFESTSPFVTIEFQGGEPLVNFPVVQHIIEYARKKNETIGKQLEFTMVSNFALLLLVPLLAMVTMSSDQVQSSQFSVAADYAAQWVHILSWSVKLAAERLKS